MALTYRKNKKPFQGTGALSDLESPSSQLHEREQLLADDRPVKRAFFKEISLT